MNEKWRNHATSVGAMYDQLSNARRTVAALRPGSMEIAGNTAALLDDQILAKPAGPDPALINGGASP